MTGRLNSSNNRLHKPVLSSLWYSHLEEMGLVVARNFQGVKLSGGISGLSRLIREILSPLQVVQAGSCHFPVSRC